MRGKASPVIKGLTQVSQFTAAMCDLGQDIFSVPNCELFLPLGLLFLPQAARSMGVYVYSADTEPA